MERETTMERETAQAKVERERRASEMRQRIADENPEALFADGLDEALIGPMRRCGQPTLAAYSYRKAVEALMRPGSTFDEGLSYEDAVEWMEFNVVNAWMGPNTPAWVYDEDDDAS